MRRRARDGRSGFAVARPAGGRVLCDCQGACVLESSHAGRLAVGEFAGIHDFRVVLDRCVRLGYASAYHGPDGPSGGAGRLARRALSSHDWTISAFPLLRERSPVP